jgi:glycosyltransferase involved in cell wall biosynthesis
MKGGVPAVSVVIATYNMGRYLDQAIASVLDQSMDDLDVHVVDDGSTDNTREVVARFSSDPRVHYYWQENAGQTRAKNHGVHVSRAPLIAFCDADDLWKPDKLERQCPLFDRDEGVGVVYSRSANLMEDGTEIDQVCVVPYRAERITADLFKYNFIPFGTAVVRRRCLEQFGAFDERYRMGIDWELWLRLSLGYEFAFLDAVTYVYRIWPGQMSGNWRGRYEYAFKIMQDFLKSHPDAIPKEVVREAWAHSFVERARARSEFGGEHRDAIRDIVTALKHKPDYVYAWKSLGRVCLTAAGIQSSAATG